MLKNKTNYDFFQDLICLSITPDGMLCFFGILLIYLLFQLKEYSQKAVEILRAQNHNLTNHPNSNIYKYVTSAWSF